MKYKLILTSLLATTFFLLTPLLVNAECVFAEGTKTLGTGQCGENVYWTLYADGTLDLEGTGATYDYTLNYSLVNNDSLLYEQNSEFGFPTWFDNDAHEEIKKINVNEGITRIGDLTFYNISSKLEQINLPDSLEEIGYFAFSSFGRLGDISRTINKIPDNLKVIESGGLMGVDFDEKIVLPESMEKIGSLAFITAAKEYVIPQNVKEISPLAFGVIDDADYVDNTPIYDPFTEEKLDQFWKFMEVAIYRKDIDSVIDMFKADTGVTVYGYTDTAAETYANENNFEFVPLNEETTTTTSAISTSTETTTTVVENTTTETSSETTSQNTTTTSGSTTTAVSTTSKKSSAKEDSPKTGDKGIIGIGAVLSSALGMFCISKKRQ